MLPLTETAMHAIPNDRAETSTSEQTINLRLVLNVTYAPNGVEESELREMLQGIVQHAANRGLLTSDTPAEVESYDHSVERIAGQEIGDTAEEMESAAVPGI